jgi:hypothetical protein
VSNKPKIRDFHKLKPIPLMQNFDHWGIYFIGPFVLEKKKTLSICNYGHRSIHEVSRRSGCWIDNCVRSYKFSFEKILCHYGCLVHTSFDPGAHFFANTYKGSSMLSSLLCSVNVCEWEDKEVASLFKIIFRRSQL